MEAPAAFTANGFILHVGEVLPAVALETHLKIDVAVVHDGVNVGAMSLLLGQPERPHKWCLATAGRVRAGHCACPDIRDGRCHSCSPTGGDFDVGVVLADTFLGHVAHLVGVVANVFCQPCRPRPIDLLIHGSTGMHGLLPAETSRDVNHCTVERDRNGVQVGGVAHESETLRLQRQGSSTSKWVEKLGQFIVWRVLYHLSVCICIQFLVADIAPVCELADHVMKSLAFSVLFFFGGEQLRMLGRIVHHAGEDNAACGGKRSTRPPQVQRRGMPLAD